MADGGAADRVVLALVTGAHGIRGEVRLKSFTTDPGALAEYGSLERSDGGPPLDVVAVRPAKDGLIVRFRSVSDRNGAESLKGVELSVPRERLPEPEAEEFYYADLVGLAAVRLDGSLFGEVIAVHNFGAGDVLEVRLADGRETVFLPFTGAVVPKVDLASGRVTIDPPEGLIEE